LAVLTISAGTMLWLFWRFPLATALITLAVLAALGVSARMAHSSDDHNDVGSGKHSV
jgi:hypothetical protein